MKQIILKVKPKQINRENKDHLRSQQLYRSNVTPTKRGKQIKLDRKAKQKNWED